MRCRRVLLRVLVLAQGALRAAARLAPVSAALLIPNPPARAAPLQVRVAVTSVEGERRCPRPQELLAALRRALPTSDALYGSADPGSEVVVRDLGAEYVVRVLGQRRRFSDPLRSCDERARVAAVFSSLALHPPGLIDGAAAAVAPLRPGPTALVEAAGLLGGAAGAVEPILTGGGAVRFYVGKPTIGASLGLHGLAPQTQRLADGSVRAFLLPVDLSVRLRWLGPHFEVAGEAGVLLSLLQLDAGPGAPAPLAATTFTAAEPVLRVDAGLRLAVDLRSWLSARVAPLVGIDAWLWPRPYQLVVAPQGVVAERPWLMVVGRVGLSIRLR